jgi:hypothetical protein
MADYPFRVERMEPHGEIRARGLLNDDIRCARGVQGSDQAVSETRDEAAQSGADHGRAQAEEVKPKKSSRRSGGWGARGGILAIHSPE